MVENRKTYIMQRVQRAVGSKTVKRYRIFEFETKEKTERFIRQCDAAYEASLAPSSKSKRRKSGLATTTSYAYQRPPNSKTKKERRYWVILLVSDGAGLVEREELIDLKKQRIELDGYELVHDGATWSWKMTRETVKYWEDRIRRVCATRPENRNLTVAQSLVKSIADAPKFRLVRRQIGELFSLYKKEWKRLRPENSPMPEFPSFLPYVRQIAKVEAPESQERRKRKAEREEKERYEALVRKIFRLDLE